MHDVAIDLSNGIKPVEVHEMSREAGLEVIKKRLGDGISDEDTLELLDELGSIPLAITQALSLIIKRKWTIRQYIDSYRKSDQYRK